jgi:signal peptidase I
MRFLKDILFYLVTISFLLGALFVFKIAFVSGTSMMPTYDGKEVSGVNMLATQDDIRYGDQMVFDCSGKGLMLDNCVKRVIGKPFDRIMIRDSVVYLNGQALKRRQLAGAEVRQHMENAKVDNFHNTLSKAVTFTFYEERLPTGESYVIQVAAHPDGYLPYLEKRKRKARNCTRSLSLLMKA